MNKDAPVISINSIYKKYKKHSLEFIGLFAYNKFIINCEKSNNYTGGYYGQVSSNL